MQPERWKRIKEIFHSAADCEPAKRPALLDAACGFDTALRQEVESLLASHEHSGFTNADVFQQGVRVLEQRAGDSQEGRRIGPYRIVRRIGRGGMGSVYLAARADEAYEKLVAIKIIRHDLDSEDIIGRFRSERQILARLDHPNISRLLDAGATEEGLPYLVMEYIDGQPIDEFCDKHKLNITERLKLFQGVCAAVRYAHQNLVIHRDIKPGNVLVTKEGIPRLLDFGIAKLLSLEASSGDATVTIARRLTPEYASPEQIRGEPITTASDVYSLGVLLYRLLTGHSPYCLPGYSTAEVEHAICEAEPEKPSASVLRPTGSAGDEVSLSSASGRVTSESTLEKLRRRLQGDLDNILLKALRKEPQRRYASADQLSEDIDRHLGNIPVIARPDTAGYRTAKFIARHKMGVTAAAALVITLATGVAATVWQARIGAGESKRARVEAARAQRISSFLQDTLSFSSPSFGSTNPEKNADAKVSEAVDLAAKRVESELADQPEILAAVQRTIGEVYSAQARYDQAEPLLRSARDKYIKLYGPDSHEIVVASSSLANVLVRKGKSEEAEELFRKNIAIEREEAKHGRLHATTLAGTLSDYGGLLDARGDSAAEAYLKEALQYSFAFTGKDRAVVAMTYNDLGDVAYRRGDLAESERCNRAALEEYRKLPEGKYAEMGASLSNLGAVLIRENKYSEAEPFVREGLELRQKVLGNAHPDTAMSFFRLSDLLYREGKYPEAENAARESVAVFSRAFVDPKTNVFFANPLMELGLIFDKTSRFREAEGYLREALELRIGFLPKGNQLIGTTEGALGECLTAQKRFAEAEPLLIDSYNVIRATSVEHDSRRTDAVQRLAALYSAWHKPSKAALYSTVSSSGEAPRQ